MSTRWWTLGVWAVVAACAVYWGLKLFVPAPALPPRTQVAELGGAPRGDLTRLLGVDAPVVVATPEEAPADARFQLIGVVSAQAGNAPREGLALIAVDGKPAKAFRVGSIIDGQTVLQAVTARSAKLGPRDGAVQVALNIAPPAPAAVGTLPLANALPGTVPVPVPSGPAPYPMQPRPTSIQSPIILPAPPGQTGPIPRRPGMPMIMQQQQPPMQQAQPQGQYQEQVLPGQTTPPQDPTALR